MIGTSDGRQFDDKFSFDLDRPISTQKADSKGDVPSADASKRDEPMNIDRDHHVPLVASALINKDGDMYGMAIDSRIPENKKYEEHLWDHEEYETEYMKHLLKIGYSNQDAYHKAHDWSTQRESAAVEADMGKDGLEAYKQHWRDAASIAAEPSDKDRHMDAHTTRYGLDESELGQKFAMNDKIDKDDKPKLPKADPSNALKPLQGTTTGPETVGKPAILTRKGEMIEDVNHTFAYQKLIDQNREDDFVMDGFVSSRGNWLTRDQAAALGKKNDQLIRGNGTGGGISEDYKDSPANQ